uniref:DNA excision repair protein ERCC-6 n=1 Tax=Lingulaulax polyedra TaxID=160621 RepID=A0A516AFZ0_LINPO|nr:DNA excision repair protein ERCC-6 [Lingulodinium polyedra]
MGRMEEATPAGSVLRPGMVVRLCGLQTLPELNGVRATCERWNAASGRWTVRLEGSGEKRVRPQNLTPDDGWEPEGKVETLQPGATVRLHSLVSLPELNGVLAKCERWIPDGCRWQVRLPTGEAKRVRVANIEAAEPEVSVLGRDDERADARRAYVKLSQACRAKEADNCDDFVVPDAEQPSAATAAAPPTPPAPPAPPPPPRGPSAARPASAAAAPGPAAAPRAPATAQGEAPAPAAKRGREAEGAAAESREDGQRGPKARRTEGAGPGGFRLGQEVWTGGPKKAGPRPPKEGGCSTSSRPRPSADDVTVEEGLSCPRWLWDSLYPYQQEGVRWLCSLHRENVGGVLADDPGMGKTVQTVAFLACLHNSGVLQAPGDAGGAGGALVVCPATLIGQWQQEIRLWYGALSVRVVHSADGNVRKEAARTACSEEYVTITSYETLRAVGEHLLEACWHVVVLDEGHKIRNPDSLGTLAVKRLQTARRIVLSGAPIQNGLQELWSLLDFARPGCLGTLPTFQEELANFIEAGGSAGVDQARAATAYQMANALRELTKPWVCRRTKLEVMDTIKLPDKQEQVLLCHLTAEQYAAYLCFLQARQGCAQDAGQAAFAINSLRKLCNHPDLLIGQQGREAVPKSMWSSERSGKLKVLAQVMKQWRAEGHRVLVFVQTKMMCQVIQHWMDLEGYCHLPLDVKVPVHKRISTIEEFNANTEYFAMVLTTRIGGVGLNIIGADRVVLFDPDWNPMTDLQARERAWRIGQNRDVVVYRLILAGTIEEKIYQRQARKHGLSQKVLLDPGHWNLFRRVGDLLAVPPPPTNTSMADLAKLKEKYKALFEHLGPQEADYQDERVVDIMKAISELSTAQSQASAAKAGEPCALLQTLFDSGGIRASFSHDSVERVLVDKRLVREAASAMASRAIEALKASSLERAGHSIREPTWTGKNGLAGAPAGMLRAAKLAAAAGDKPSKRTKAPAVAGLREALQRLAAAADGSFTSTHRSVAEAILRAFLNPDIAGPDHCLSTEQVLQHVAAGYGAERRDIFKSLLKRLCKLSKPKENSAIGTWSLRDDYWPEQDGVADAGG